MKKSSEKNSKVLSELLINIVIYIQRSRLFSSMAGLVSINMIKTTIEIAFFTD